MRSTLVSFVDRASRAASVVATLCLIAIVISVTADAMGRYLFSRPIIGVHAIVGGLLHPVLIFFGSALVARSNGHMRVQVVRLDRWPTLKRAIENLFAWLISLFWGVVAWQASVRVYEAYAMNQWPVGEIAVPAIVSYGAVAIGAALAAVAHLTPSGEAREACT